MLSVLLPSALKIFSIKKLCWMRPFFKLFFFLLKKVKNKPYIFFPYRFYIHLYMTRTWLGTFFSDRSVFRKILLLVLDVLKAQYNFNFSGIINKRHCFFCHSYTKSVVHLNKTASYREMQYNRKKNLTHCIHALFVYKRLRM